MTAPKHNSFQTIGSLAQRLGCSVEAIEDIAREIGVHADLVLTGVPFLSLATAELIEAEFRRQRQELERK